MTEHTEKFIDTLRGIAAIPKRKGGDPKRQMIIGYGQGYDRGQTFSVFETRALNDHIAAFERLQAKVADKTAEAQSLRGEVDRLKEMLADAEEQNEHLLQQFGCAKAMVLALQEDIERMKEK